MIHRRCDRLYSVYRVTYNYLQLWYDDACDRDDGGGERRAAPLAFPSKSNRLE